MATIWTSPVHSRGEVDRAGRTYVDTSAKPEERELALATINNWRSSHSFPLNTLQMNLRNRAAAVDSDATIAQRIKRLPSIRHKLDRFPEMKLSRMQDLGGCRAVVASVAEVDRLVGYYKGKSRVKHKLLREDYYIATPAPSGYRSTHLVWGYYSDKNDAWNGLRIEMQIRSRLQHAWATAVETVGTFTQQALKSSWGEEAWLRFFALMSSALALREGTPCVPDTPSDPLALSKELMRYAKKLSVVERLTAYGSALQFAEELAGAGELGKKHFLLLELDIERQQLSARAYTNAVAATDAYGAIERAIEEEQRKDAVLVSVDSLAGLRRAYPNYFLDTAAFVEAVREAIG